MASLSCLTIVLTLKSLLVTQLSSLEVCLSHQEVGFVRGGDHGVQERLVGQHLPHVAKSLILDLNMKKTFGEGAAS